MPDSETRGRAGRLVAEGLVVLFSILAAFLLEGWRADRELAGELSQELVSVQRELEANRASDRARLTERTLLLSSAVGRS